MDFLNKTENINPREWWRRTRKLRGDIKTTLIPTITDNGCPANSNREKADVFNKMFASFSSLDDSNAEPLGDTPHSEHSLNRITTTEEEVFDTLRNLKVTNSVGPDDIHALILKNCANGLKGSLTYIINKSLEIGKYPSSWKNANIIPIYKKGDKSNPKNYRPISLLCVPSKIMERVVHKHIFNFLRDKQLLHRSQYGFIPNNSCVHQLVYIHDMIMQALDNKKQIRMIFCDITKAFDRVWHKGLLHKCRSLGITGRLLEWLKDYLSERKQRVNVDGTFSDWNGILAGVPQGSVLGPLLFLIFINDLPNEMSNHVKLFADDTTLFLEFDSQNNIAMEASQQRDIKMLEKWAKKWLVTFNPSKTECVTFHTRQTAAIGHNLQLMNTSIPNVESHIHLGLTMHSHGNWTEHIKRICTNTTRKINMIRPLTYKLDRQTLLKLVTCFIRPNLEYGSIVWDNCTKQLKDNVDKVYESALRVIVGAPSTCNRTKLYNETAQPTCQTRRNKSRLLFMHRIVHGESDNELKDLLERPFRALPGREFDLRVKRTSTSLYHDSFIPKTIREWNKLPSELKLQSSYSKFKRLLLKLPSFRPKSSNKYYNLGKRGINILMSRIRMECSDLNSHKRKRGLRDTAACECGAENETPTHYFLHCKRYSLQRQVLISEVGPLSLNQILHGSDLSNPHLFINSVSKFIYTTKRFR